MSSFRYHLPTDFFSELYICFHVLHNVQHKISQMFMMLKHSLVLTYFQDYYVEVSINDQSDFYVILNILQKITIGYISRHWVELVLAVREISGKGQGFFCQTRGNPDPVRDEIIHPFTNFNICTFEVLEWIYGNFIPHCVYDYLYMPRLKLILIAKSRPRNLTWTTIHLSTPKLKILNEDGFRMEVYY